MLEAVAAAARRGRARGDQRGASDASAIASSSRGRSSTSSSPAVRRASIAATPPFLKSTRRAGEVVDDLREGRARGRRRGSSRRGARRAASSASTRLKPLASECSRDRLDVQALAGELGGLPRAHLRARVTGVELLAQRGQRAPGGLGLGSPARRQLPLVVGLGVVRHGLAVPQHPQLRRHQRRVAYAAA